MQLFLANCLLISGRGGSHIGTVELQHPILPLDIIDNNSSPSIIRIIKSRRMRWAGHVAQMGRIGMHIGYWWACQKERDH
jgi:hypothetical protein